MGCPTWRSCSPLDVIYLLFIVHFTLFRSFNFFIKTIDCDSLGVHHHPLSINSKKNKLRKGLRRRNMLNMQRKTWRNPDLLQSRWIVLVKVCTTNGKFSLSDINSTEWPTESWVPPQLLSVIWKKFERFLLSYFFNFFFLRLEYLRLNISGWIFMWWQLSKCLLFGFVFICYSPSSLYLLQWFVVSKYWFIIVCRSIKDLKLKWPADRQDFLCAHTHSAGISSCHNKVNFKFLGHPCRSLAQCCY